MIGLVTPDEDGDFTQITRRVSLAVYRQWRGRGDSSGLNGASSRVPDRRRSRTGVGEEIYIYIYINVCVRVEQPKVEVKKRNQSVQVMGRWIKRVTGQKEKKTVSRSSLGDATTVCVHGVWSMARGEPELGGMNTAGD